MTQVSVIYLKVETQYDQDVECNITLLRHSDGVLVRPSPDITDMPEDFKQALIDWLGGESNLKDKVESLAQWAVPANYLGGNHNGPWPAFRVKDVMEVLNR